MKGVQNSVRNRSDAPLCEGIVHAALFRHVRARSPRRAPESVCEISISLFTEGSLGLPLIESQSVSQSVCRSDAVHTYRTVREACTHACTHTRDHLRAIIFLPFAALSIERVDNRALKSLVPGRREGEDPLLSTAGDVRGDGVKSQISHASNGTRAPL